MNEHDLLQLLGGNIRKIRTVKSFSQSTLALKTGMAPNSINDIENGNRWVSAKSLSKIAKALEVEPYTLLLPPSFKKDALPDSIKLYHEDIYKAVLSAIEDVRQRYNIE